MMRCEEAESLLAELTFGDLDDERTAELRAHIESCKTCRELAGDMRVAAKLLKDGVELESPVLSDEAKTELVQKASGATRGRPAVRAGFLGWLAAAAVLLVLIGMLASSTFALRSRGRRMAFSSRAATEADMPMSPARRPSAPTVTLNQEIPMEEAEGWQFESDGESRRETFAGLPQAKAAPSYRAKGDRPSAPSSQEDATTDIPTAGVGVVGYDGSVNAFAFDPAKRNVKELAEPNQAVAGKRLDAGRERGIAPIVVGDAIAPPADRPMEQGIAVADDADGAVSTTSPGRDRNVRRKTEARQLLGRIAAEKKKVATKPRAVPAPPAPSAPMRTPVAAPDHVEPAAVYEREAAAEPVRRSGRKAQYARLSEQIDEAKSRGDMDKAAGLVRQLEPYVPPGGPARTAGGLVAADPKPQLTTTAPTSRVANLQSTLQKLSRAQQAARDPAKRQKLRKAMVRVNTELGYEQMKETGDRALQRGDNARAMREYQKALRMKDTPEVRARIRDTEAVSSQAAGQVALEAGNVPEAVANFENALQLRPTHELSRKLEQAKAMRDRQEYLAEIRNAEVARSRKQFRAVASKLKDLAQKYPDWTEADSALARGALPEEQRMIDATARKQWNALQAQVSKAGANAGGKIAAMEAALPGLAGSRYEAMAERSLLTERDKLARAKHTELMASVRKVKSPQSKLAVLRAALGTFEGTSFKAQIEAAIRRDTDSIKHAEFVALNNGLKKSKSARDKVAKIEAALPQFVGSSFEKRLRKVLEREKTDLKTAEYRALLTQLRSHSSSQLKISELGRRLPDFAGTAYERILTKIIDAEKANQVAARFKSFRAALAKEKDHRKKIARLEAAYAQFRGTRYERAVRRALRGEYPDWREPDERSADEVGMNWRGSILSVEEPEPVAPVTDATNSPRYIAALALQGVVVVDVEPQPVGEAAPTLQAFIMLSPQEAQTLDESQKRAQAAKIHALELVKLQEVEQPEEEPVAAHEADESLPPPPVNPFVLTARDNFSTFAMDVDTAAYSIARNYIRRRALPPRRSVRMEEFVNAFDYNYPRQDRETFSIFAEGMPSPFGRGLQLVKVGIQARVLGREGRKPAHLIFVVDSSGSMDLPDRLPLVKSAVKMLLGELGGTDRVSLVSYGAGPRLLIEARVATQRQAIEATVDEIQCGGSTNLFEGLKLGYEVARRQFRSGEINRVVLCSDGVANVGLSEAEEILQRVAKFRDWGVTLTSAGFGAGAYSDEMLERLANSGDGNYVFIDSEDEARTVFVEKMSATIQNVAKDAKIQVEFDQRSVRRYRLIGYENRDIADKDFRNDAVDAGEVGSGQSVTALYEVELVDPDEPLDLGTVYVRYRDVDSGEVQEISRRLQREMLKTPRPAQNPRLYLAACVAEFAEVLRGSEHARGGSLAAVRRTLTDVSTALPLDKRVKELESLVSAARRIRGER